MIENKSHQDLSFFLLAISFYFLFIIFKLSEASLSSNYKYQRNYNFSLFFVFISIGVATSYILRNIGNYSSKGVDRQNLAVIIMTCIVYFCVLILLPSILDKF